VFNPIIKLEQRNIMKKLIIFTLSVLISQSAICMDIFEAAGNGNLERVQELLALGTPVNATDNDGWTPLHFAAFENKVDIVLNLLYFGAKIDAESKERDRWTPLDLATMHNNSDVIQLLKDWPLYKRGNIQEQRERIKALVLTFQQILGYVPVNITCLIGQFACPEFFKAHPDLIPFDAKLGDSNHSLQEIHQIADRMRQQNSRKRPRTEDQTKEEPTQKRKRRD